jgi:inosose dehydratase
MKIKTSRRNFLSSLAFASLATPSLLAAKVKEVKARNLPISCSTYNWVTFYRRQGKEWGKDWEACISEFAQTGIPAIEPSFLHAEEVKTLAPILKKYNILMPSLYVSSLLHKADQAEKSITSVLKIADEAKKLMNTQIVVTNPSPIRWGSNEVKSDAELIEQAKNIEKLGTELRKKGITLAYHTHDMEMLAGAREFHHILLNTSPANVAFCFDVHWVYRGSQNSQVAVFDVLKLYGKRIVELHIRQSEGGTWTETFAGEGDIDYLRFVREMEKMRIKPHLVIEQCLEEKTNVSLSAIEAHRQDLASIKKVFGREGA